MHEVPVSVRSIDALRGLARARDLERFHDVARRLAPTMRGRTLWHVNSTDSGGGVAELLHQLLGYVVEAAIACRWIVVEGTPPFFAITKRIHNRLHGSPGDGGELGGAERSVYRAVLDTEGVELLSRVRAGDVAVLHDPQTAGLVRPLVETGVHVIWVSHVGIDQPDDLVRSAWAFLRDEVEPADAFVFTRAAYAWEGLDRRRTNVIPPCIDPTSPKNAELETAAVTSVLAAAGLTTALERRGIGIDVADAGRIRVRRRADVTEEDVLPPGAPLVVQVSRWDRLKDHVGVLRGFAEHVAPRHETHLMLVGPSSASVSDDPEGAAVFAEVLEAWKQLPADRRERIHLVNLPVQDRLENALVVNALQRRADVVVQKSLAEGFGLTVAEAMWKARPVVGSRVGGIQEQIRDGRSGLLVPPADLEAFGDAVTSLIGDLGFAHAIGHAARLRVRTRFLPPRYLADQLALVHGIVGGRA